MKRIDTSKSKPGFDTNDPLAYDDYSKLMDNYMDTKYIEGSNWNVELYTNPYFMILAVLVVIIVVAVIYWFVRNR